MIFVVGLWFDRGFLWFDRGFSTHQKTTVTPQRHSATTVTCGFSALTPLTLFSSTVTVTWSFLQRLWLYTFKTSPYVPAPRTHVSQHVHVVPGYTGMFRVYTRVRFEWTHGDVLNGHTRVRGVIFSSAYRNLPRRVIHGPYPFSAGE